MGIATPPGAPNKGGSSFESPHANDASNDGDSVGDTGLGPLRPGSRFADRYRLERELDPVGPAISWLAVDEKLNRAVVVYVMPPGPAADTAIEAARSAATIRDPRFLQVLDAVQDGSAVYIITEWITDAADLSAGLAFGPLPAWEATYLASEMVGALAASHAKSLSHLGLTPRNVLRTGGGQVKIHGLCLDAALTGTTAPTAPEASAVDLRGVGSLFYAALTARWPFGVKYGLPGAPVDDHGPVPPGQLVSDLPDGVDDIVLAMLGTRPSPNGPLTWDDATAQLARLPRSRPRRPDATTTITELPAVPPQPPAATPPPPPERRRWPVVLTALAIVVAIGLAVLAVQLLAPSGGTPTLQPTVPSTTTTAPRQLRIASASVWSASSSGEHSDDAANTITGKDGGWRTSAYKDGPQMQTKPGTGIIYDLGSVQTVGAATVRIGAAGATLQMLVAGDSVDQVPDPVAGQAPPGFTDVDTQTAASTTVTLAPDQPVKTRFVLVWFTSLPKQPTDGSHPYPYYDSIVQVTLLDRAAAT